MIFSVGFHNRQVIDARNPAAHKAVLVKLPILIAVGAIPVAGIVMPLVGEAHRDPIATKRPKLLDETIVQLLIPLAGEELDNGIAPGKKLRAVSPNAVRRIGEGYPNR